MNPISTSSLFHFTDKYDTLKLILQNGLRYSYSTEWFPIEVVKYYLEYIGENIKGRKYPYICLPLISFCDTPLTRVGQHAKRYGKYFIGIEKSYVNFSQGLHLNPMLYANSYTIKSYLADISYILNIIKLIESYSKQTGIALNSVQEQLPYGRIFAPFIDSSELSAQHLAKGNNILVKRFKELIAIYKPIQEINRNHTNYYYIDEREWRTYLPDEIASWKWGLSKTMCKNNKNAWTESISSKYKYFTIIPQFLYCINHIAVEFESQREDIINFIRTSPKLFGHQVSNQIERDKFRDLLISTVTSFEKIENDY